MNEHDIMNINAITFCKMDWVRLLEKSNVDMVKKMGRDQIRRGDELYSSLIEAAITQGTRAKTGTRIKISGDSYSIKLGWKILEALFLSASFFSPFSVFLPQFRHKYRPAYVYSSSS